jgi:rubrerythrin
MRLLSLFAKHADIEGYPEIAGLFRDAAEGKSL